MLPPYVDFFVLSDKVQFSSFQRCLNRNQRKKENPQLSEHEFFKTAADILKAIIIHYAQNYAATIMLEIRPAKVVLIIFEAKILLFF